MPRNQRPFRSTRAYQLSDNIRNARYVEERLSSVQPVLGRAASSIFALPTAVAAQVCTMLTPQGVAWEYYQTTAQLLQPVPHATKGLVLDGDQLDNEAAEYVPGGNSANSPFAFTVGASSDFFFEATLEIADASGSDQLLVGWRKQEAFAVPTSFLNAGDGIYTDFFGIGFCATKANPNPVGVASDIGNSGSTVATPISFTWADAGIHKLGVRVVGGKAIAFINGVRLGGGPITLDGAGVAMTSQSPISTPAYTFTAGLQLVPFIFVRQDADLLDSVHLRSYAVGNLVEAGLDPAQE
jgi:hypothetical protein